MPNKLKEIAISGNAQRNLVKKHTSAIHISNEITAIERKISNVLLKNAFKTMSVQEQHQIGLRELIKEIGWENTEKTPQHFIDSIKRLNTTQVEWNILGKDKRRKWGVTTLLAGVEIEAGIVSYSYSQELRQWLGNPNIYASLDLEYQKKLKSKYSLALWEFCTEQLDSVQSTEINAKPIEFTKLRGLLGVQQNRTYSEYKNFNRTILKPAIKEINEKTDLEVKAVPKKTPKKTSNIIFGIKRKSINQQIKMFTDEEGVDTILLLRGNIQHEDALGKGQRLKLDNEAVLQYIRDYGVAKVINCFDFTIEKIKQGSKIKNINGYIWTLLDRGITESPSFEEVHSGLLQLESQQKQKKEEGSKQQIIKIIQEERDAVRQKILIACAEVMHPTAFLEMAKIMEIIKFNETDLEVYLSIFMNYRYSVGIEQKLGIALEKEFAIENKKTFIRIETDK